MPRDAVLNELALAVGGGGSPLIGIDGPDAAGKTTLADELAALLSASGRDTVRVSLDGFHRPAAERLVRGQLSAVGYLDDSFDLVALRRDVLDPLAPGGDRRIVPARYDWRSESSVTALPLQVPHGAYTIVDGVFLLRRELARYWSATVFVFARHEEVLQRARIRDAEAMGGTEAVTRRYRSRYLPGQALYLARERPHERATVCVENSDPADPVVSPERVAAGVARWLEAYGR